MSEETINVESYINTNFSDDYKERLKELEETSKSLCTQLKERLIALTASVKDLKEKVSMEKGLWSKELKETIELEKKLSEYKLHNHFPGGDFNYQLEMITDTVLKTHAMKTAQIQKEIDTNIYRQKLLEAESMCKLEMLKIKNSLECLVPLQAIVNEWNSDKQLSATDDSKVENFNDSENSVDKPNNDDVN